MKLKQEERRGSISSNSASSEDLRGRLDHSSLLGRLEFLEAGFLSQGSLSCPLGLILPSPNHRFYR
jgi:hypothetical protein